MWDYKLMELLDGCSVCGKGDEGRWYLYVLAIMEMLLQETEESRLHLVRYCVSTYVLDERTGLTKPFPSLTSVGSLYRTCNLDFFQTKKDKTKGRGPKLRPVSQSMVGKWHMSGI